jgi:hypothetical protein
VEKYGTAGEPTDNNIIGHMRFTFWIRMTTKHAQNMAQPENPQITI